MNVFRFLRGENDLTAKPSRRPGLGNASAGTPPERRTRTREELERTVVDSMKSALSLIEPCLASDAYDDAMIHLGVNGDYFVESLGQHEVQTLGCALYMQKRGKALTYLAVHQITDQFAGKAMNTPMIYKSLNRLVARGLLIGDDQAQTEGGEALRTKAYRITDSGKAAFRLAIWNARILAASQQVVAA